MPTCPLAVAIPRQEQSPTGLVSPVTGTQQVLNKHSMNGDAGLGKRAPEQALHPQVSTLWTRTGAWN